jgi:hypothetical protein
MKATITTFQCDNCGAVTKDEKQFPYEKNWIYLYSLNFQKPRQEGKPEYVRIQKSDMHFCGSKCLMELVVKQIQSVQGKEPQKIVTEPPKINLGLAAQKNKKVK